MTFFQWLSQSLCGVLSALCYLVILQGPARADEPTTKPILRIESGMHTAPIRSISVDAASRYLVTGSEDKTVRVWELSSGRLLQTLRPPIGDGNDGMIYAVALSPDGRTIACGGWTGEWEGARCIYLFDRQSGQILHRITGLPEVTLHLAYSRDGRFLAAGLGRNNGIRIYRTGDYAAAGQDTDYKDSVFDLDFDGNNRLVTVSQEGYIRLYNGDYRLLQKRKTPGGEWPIGVAFSPDGTKVAVGFHDTTNVNIFSGTDLSFLYAPNTTGVDGAICSVCWSRDGQ